MAQVNLAKHTYDLAFAEAIVWLRGLDATPEEVSESREGLASHLAVVDGEAGIAGILESEKNILLVERSLTTTSPAMRRSIDTALSDLDAALRIYAGASEDPAYYRRLDRDFSQRRNRTNEDLPKDQARQFFGSHLTRLRNRDKDRKQALERKVLRARIRAIRTAEQQYINLQRQVLDGHQD